MNYYGVVFWVNKNIIRFKNSILLIMKMIKK